MNNSKIAEVYAKRKDEESFDRSPLLRERQSKIAKIVRALEGVKENEDWKVLEEELFSDTVELIERLIQIESQKKDINSPEIYRLQGQLIWAKKYAKLEKLIEGFKVELKNIKKQLK